MIRLSCILPSYKDKYMPATVKSLLDNSGLKPEELEIVVVLDGYEPNFELVEDPRVRYVRQENTGMRGAINTGVREAKGEFIARFDEHCMVAKNWDKIILDGPFEDNWIMTLSRHELDPVKWEVMSKEPKNFAKLIIAEDQAKTKFAGVTWHTKNRTHKDVDIAETMAMQGSMWIMKKSWWEKVIGELQTEGYGPLYQDSVEMVFKTWQAGGKLILNKKGWYAHKHRTFKRTHNINGEDSQRSFDYAIATWNDYYQTVIRPRFKV